jgi:hypothetical protein
MWSYAAALNSLMLQTDCPAGSTLCNASHLLPWLYAAAAVLAVVLVLVIVLAIRVWRKNKHEDFER